MTMLLISIHDRKAETFSNPVPSQNKATAIREFQTAVNQPGSLLNSHPDDFELHQLAVFDPTSPDLRCDHEVLCSARDVFAIEKES